MLSRKCTAKRMDDGGLTSGLIIVYIHFQLWYNLVSKLGSYSDLNLNDMILVIL